MSWLSKGITALRARRAYKKEVKEMGLFSKETVKSATTQNVAVGTAAGGGAVALVLSWVRSTWGLPWDASADTSVIVVLTAVIGPLLSRLVAFWRDPAKRTGGEGVSKTPALLVFLCAGLFAAGALGGCASMAPTVTTTAPDGTVTTRIDTEALVQLAQAQLVVAQEAMAAAEHAVQSYMAVQSAIDARSQAEWTARLAQKQAEADARRANVEYWTGLLLELRESAVVKE